jgi:preprotein translocase subunit SecE
VAQENAPNKPVHLIYLCGGVLLFFLSQWTIDWLWGFFFSPLSEMTTSLVAFAITLGVGIKLYRDDRVYGLANEVAQELSKVTWPSSKEVRAATMVVLVMSLLSATILWSFDLAWSFLTERVYG